MELTPARVVRYVPHFYFICILFVVFLHCFVRFRRDFLSEASQKLENTSVSLVECAKSILKTGTDVKRAGLNDVGRLEWHSMVRTND